MYLRTMLVAALAQSPLIAMEVNGHMIQMSDRSSNTDTLELRLDESVGINLYWTDDEQNEHYVTFPFDAHVHGEQMEGTDVEANEDRMYTVRVFALKQIYSA